MRPAALAVSDEQTALAAAVRGFAEQAKLAGAARFAADSDTEALPDAWAAVAAQELLVLPFDAKVSDLCVAIEEFGRSLAPGPIVPTLLAALLIKQYGAAELRRTVAAGLRDGSFSAAVSINGHVLGGAAVGAVVMPVDGRWYVVDTDRLDVTSATGIDPTRRIAQVEGAKPDESRLLAGLVDDEVVATAAVLLSAEATGVAGACLDIAVEYAKVREQFGQPIGGFQAVKHRCADMLTSLELAGAAAWDAAHALDSTQPGDPARSLAIAVAGGVAPQAAVDVAKSLIQVLGGIGFTWEHDAHLYLKRAMSVRQILGRRSRWHEAASALARAGVRRNRSLDLGAEAEGHRTEARKFLATLDGLDDLARRVAIADAGYLVPHWPVPYGRGAGPVEQLVIDEEFAKAGVTRPDLIIGNWALPTILQHGTDSQRSRFVPPTLHGRISWCQMFSEPGAGSDLASLSTKATRVEGGWTLSGQKVWTSAARTADWAICLARTSTGARRHDGITYFLVDMTSPGLDVRPLREITGDALFNEIFLTDVFVPDDCVVGEVDGGWKLARTTLANERVAMSSGSAFPSGIEELLAALAQSGDTDDPVALERIGELVCVAQADAMLGVRATLARVSGTDPGAASSVRKLVGMHLRQDSAELALELLGPRATSMEDDAQRTVLRRMLSTRSLTIAGGTSEVLHNVIGERILGLPR
ncbi:MAG TPA: acyl-CoA dehydrogenase [Mycobacteriales bacterium]|nr:acyl-CoA dehydrogenase [Mycobacteriales bacterium]HVX69164.1 acyl-CoA dehydrogenase [Mycobacteriales bacterium]